MDDDVVGAVLRDSRKPRKNATCYPCKRRKVKCDRGRPCQVCVGRGHSFLCLYEGKTNRSRAPPPKTSSESQAPQKSDTTSKQDSETDSVILILSEQLKSYHQELRHLRAHHKHCEALQDEVSQLRVRCEEYEAVIAGMTETRHTQARMSDKSESAVKISDRPQRLLTQSPPAGDHVASRSQVCSSVTSPTSHNDDTPQQSMAAPVEIADSDASVDEVVPCREIDEVPTSIATSHIPNTLQSKHPMTQPGRDHHGYFLGDSAQGGHNVEKMSPPGNMNLMGLREPFNFETFHAQHYRHTNCAEGVAPSQAAAIGLSSHPENDWSPSAGCLPPSSTLGTFNPHQGFPPAALPFQVDLINRQSFLNATPQWWESHPTMDVFAFDPIANPIAFTPSSTSMSSTSWDVPCHSAQLDWSPHPPMVLSPEAYGHEQSYAQYLSNLSNR